MRAILKTKNKTVESIMKEAYENPKAMELTREDAELWKKINDAWDGAEVGLTEDGFLEGWANDIESDEKMRNALYLLEQDDMIGRYKDDRDGFEYDLDMYQYDLDGGIQFKPEEYEVIQETARDKYLRLSKSHPWLETVILAEGSSEGVYEAEFSACYIMDYIQDDYGKFMYKTAMHSAVEELAEHADVLDEKAMKDAWKIIKSLAWKRAIFLEVRASEE